MMPPPSHAYGPSWRVSAPACIQLAPYRYSIAIAARLPAAYLLEMIDMSQEESPTGTATPFALGWKYDGGAAAMLTLFAEKSEAFGGGAPSGSAAVIRTATRRSSQADRSDLVRRHCSGSGSAGGCQHTAPHHCHHKHEA